LHSAGYKYQVLGRARDIRSKYIDDAKTIFYCLDNSVGLDFPLFFGVFAYMILMSFCGAVNYPPLKGQDCALILFNAKRKAAERRFRRKTIEQNHVYT
jgi:hypothetical protein